MSITPTLPLPYQSRLSVCSERERERDTHTHTRTQRHKHTHTNTQTHMTHLLHCGAQIPAECDDVLTGSVSAELGELVSGKHGERDVTR